MVKEKFLKIVNSSVGQPHQYKFAIEEKWTLVIKRFSIPEKINENQNLLKQLVQKNKKINEK